MTAQPNVVDLIDREDFSRLINYDVEQALIGTVLENNRAFDSVASFLLAEHFAGPAHQAIWERISAVIERGEQADAIRLKATEPEPGYLVKLQAASFGAVNARDYGRTLFELWQRRALIASMRDLAAETMDVESGRGLQDSLRAIQAEIDEIGQGGPGRGFVSLYDAAREALAEIERDRQLRAQGLPTALSTGLHALDDALAGGLKRQHLTILAGRPGMGKSALATQIVKHVACRGHPALIFSLEMGGSEIAGRDLAHASGVPVDRLMSGDLSDAEFDTVADETAALQKLPFYIDGSVTATVSGMMAKTRAFKRKHGGLQLVVIDYLQLMSADGRGRDENRNLELSAITRAMKTAAGSMDFCLLALSQLNRGVEARDDKRPRLADLRDSGSIEQDADRVLFVYREDYYLERAEPAENDEEKHRKWLDRLTRARGFAEVGIGKNRNGPAGGWVRLKFDGPLTRFRDIER